jgi:hypothetical protein
VIALADFLDPVAALRERAQRERMADLRKAAPTLARNLAAATAAATTTAAKHDPAIAKARAALAKAEQAARDTAAEVNRLERARIEAVAPLEAARNRLARQLAAAVGPLVAPVLEQVVAELAGLRARRPTTEPALPDGRIPTEFRTHARRLRALVHLERDLRNAPELFADDPEGIAAARLAEVPTLALEYLTRGEFDAAARGLA